MGQGSARARVQTSLRLRGHPGAAALLRPARQHPDRGHPAVAVLGDLFIVVSIGFLGP